MAGIYNAEADKQSIMATFPRFRMLEKQHGSLIRGMLASRKQRQAASDGEASGKISAFMSFYGGTSELIEALVPQLHGDLRTNARVVQITQDGDSTYNLRLEDGTKLEADVVLLTTPAYVTADLVREVAPQVAKHLNEIRYVSTGTISLAYRATDIPQPLDGFGLVIPGSEKRRINAITVASTKFDHRAPEGYVLMRIFFGGSRSPETMELKDEALVQAVRSELQSILSIEAEPLFHRVYRWWNANPQYDVGHLDRVEAIEAALPVGLYVTGSPYRGVGLPDCVHQSQQVAKKVITEFMERVQTE